MIARPKAPEVGTDWRFAAPRRWGFCSTASSSFNIGLAICERHRGAEGSQKSR